MMKEMECLIDMLIFIGDTAPWVKFLLLYIYMSIMAVIGANKTHLITTTNQFHTLLKGVHYTDVPTAAGTFAQSEAAWAV